MNKSKGLVFVISAPSGGGKSTLVRELLKRISGLTYSVSLTTRPPRGSEKSGKDYWFVPESVFLKKRDSNELIECAQVHGYWYGTPKSFIEEKVRHKVDVLLDIDIQGGRQIKKIFPEAVLIFVAPPSLSVLEFRLRKRRQDDEATIQRRLAAARAELDGARDYDYCVLNEQLAHAVDQLRCIIVSERLRMFRNPNEV